MCALKDISRKYFSDFFANYAYIVLRQLYWLGSGIY